MKLARRVNFILLPIIAGIFIISAFISDSTSYDHQIRSTKVEIAQELEGIDRRLNYKINLQDSLIQQFINSHEFSNYITLPNLFITNAAEALLTDQRKQINKISSGLLSVHLLDHAGRILLSANEQAALEDSAEPEIPKQYQRWNANQISNNSNKKSFLLRSENNKLMLGRIETFNADFATEYSIGAPVYSIPAIEEIHIMEP
jgi:hypothetical protein